jgi:hypothetical protein
MSNWICKYCGKDTSDVDYDYLDGFNHLGCTLEALTPKKKVMKIKGWEKISGYTYKGMSIVNPIHNANETKYEATVLNLNLPQKPKWELSVLMPDFKFKQDSDITIILWDENKYRATKSVSKNMVSTLTGFRILFEDLVDEVLKLRLISAAQFSSHSFNVNGTQRMHINSNGHATIGGNISSGGTINPNLYTSVTTGTGIMSTINSNGNTTTWNPNTNLPSSMLMSIKDLQEQIDNLKNKYVNNK